MTEQATAAANTTTTVSHLGKAYGYVDRALYLNEDESGILYVWAKGSDPSASGQLTFYFQISTNGSLWSDYASVNVTLDGESVVTAAESINLTAVKFLRLSRVANADTTYSATVDGSIDLG